MVYMSMSLMSVYVVLWHAYLYFFQGQARLLNILGQVNTQELFWILLAYLFYFSMHMFEIFMRIARGKTYVYVSIAEMREEWLFYICRCVCSSKFNPSYILNITNLTFCKS